jgi:DNA-binding phage protein
MQRTTEYQKDLVKALKDPVEASEYLRAAMEEGDKEAVVLAMRNVAEAHGSVKEIEVEE